MFGFIISLALLWPPPIAAHFDAPPVQQYIITSNFSFRTEEACNEKAGEFLDYVHQSTQMAKLMVNIDCHAEEVVDL